MKTVDKIVFSIALLVALVLMGSLAKEVYDNRVPMYKVGQCVRSDSTSEQWEINFVHKIDAVGKKKYKTRTVAVEEDGLSINSYIINGDLDFFIQSQYHEVPCPSELSQ